MAVSSERTAYDGRWGNVGAIREGRDHQFREFAFLKTVCYRGACIVHCVGRRIKQTILTEQIWTSPRQRFDEPHGKILPEYRSVVI